VLPEPDNPQILDKGCGSSVPIVELPRLSTGEMIGLDIDQSALDILTEKILRVGLSDRVKISEVNIFD